MTVPVRIGPYVIERRLGGGGMAEVYLASVVGEAGFSRPVAIKRVLPGFGERPDFVSLFVREAKLSARLRHPNIVSVLDFQRDPDHGLFLVMELVEGKDLDQLIGTGPLPISLAIYIATEMLRGLGYAHNPPRREDGILGVIHRDISPQNVLLSWEGEVKISDFGIAKPRAAVQATASIMIKGKPAYMSPEQADGRQLDGRSDLFSTGTVLWQMLTGQVLFQGSTTQQVLVALLMSDVRPPTLIRPDVPEDLCAVVMRLLERDPDRRYPTAEAALQDLLACRDVPRDGRSELATFASSRFPPASAAPTLVDAASAQTQLPAPAGAAAAQPVEATSRRAWAASKLWLLFVAVLVSATALTIGGSSLIASGPNARTSTPEPPPRSQAATPVDDASPRAISEERVPPVPTPTAPRPEGSTSGSIPRAERRATRPNPQKAATPSQGIIEIQFGEK